VSLLAKKSHLKTQINFLDNGSRNGTAEKGGRRKEERKQKKANAYMLSFSTPLRPTRRMPLFGEKPTLYLFVIAAMP